jgi:hypothetical protein
MGYFLPICSLIRKDKNGTELQFCLLFYTGVKLGVL